MPLQYECESQVEISQIHNLMHVLDEIPEDTFYGMGYEIAYKAASLMASYIRQLEAEIELQKMLAEEASGK